MIRFGPAGIPSGCKGGSVEGVKCCSELGLNAMELEFVRGVRLSLEKAREVGKEAENLKIFLSCHSPYYINFCSNEKEKVKKSIEHVLNSARVLGEAGGRYVVYHPGYYQKMSPREAYEKAISALRELEEKVASLGIKGIVLGPETVGKKSQFGGIDEVIKLSLELEMHKPVIDLAHIHARGDFKLEKNEDYRRLFEYIEKKIDGYMNDFHFHFSEIEFTEKGERRHLALGECGVPPIRPMLEVLKENGYSGTVISETPLTDSDAVKMRSIYESI